METMTREEEIRNAADEAYPTWEEYNIGFIEMQNNKEL